MSNDSNSPETGAEQGEPRYEKKMEDIQFNRELDKSKIDDVDSWNNWEPEQYVLLDTIEEDINLGRFGVYRRGRGIGWFNMKLSRLPFDDIENPTIFEAKIVDDRIVSMVLAPKVTELYRNL